VERVVIGDLNAHTEYDLSVQTHTNNAIGPFSSVVKCRTEEGSKWNGDHFICCGFCSCLICSL